MMKLTRLMAPLIKSVLILFLISTSNCGLYKPVDTRKVPINVNDRVEKNIQQGKGFRVFGDRKNQGGSFEFASSNPMWRASLDLLDFVPLSNVDYSGGIIITDWFSNEESIDESLKITIKFLSNEIRSDGLDIIIHKKKCSNDQNCKITKLQSVTANEIRSEILKKATLIKESMPDPNPDFKMPTPESFK